VGSALPEGAGRVGVPPLEVGLRVARAQAGPPPPAAGTLAGQRGAGLQVVRPEAAAS
jgi:hypothetical protein